MSKVSGVGYFSVVTDHNGPALWYIDSELCALPRSFYNLPDEEKVAYFAAFEACHEAGRQAAASGILGHMRKEGLR